MNLPLTLADIARVRAECDRVEAERIKLAVFHSKRESAEYLRNSAPPPSVISPLGAFLGFSGPEIAVCPLVAKEPGRVVVCRTEGEVWWAKTIIALWDAEEARRALNAYEARRFALWVEEQS